MIEILLNFPAHETWNFLDRRIHYSCFELKNNAKMIVSGNALMKVPNMKISKLYNCDKLTTYRMKMI